VRLVTKTRHLVRAGADIGIGIGAAYLFDPALGAGRRARLFQIAPRALKRTWSRLVPDASGQSEESLDRAADRRSESAEPSLRAAPHRRNSELTSGDERPPFGKELCMIGRRFGPTKDRYSDSRFRSISEGSGRWHFGVAGEAAESGGIVAKAVHTRTRCAGRSAFARPRERYERPGAARCASTSGCL